MVVPTEVALSFALRDGILAASNVRIEDISSMIRLPPPGAQSLADTSVASLLKYDESIWVPVTTLASLSWSPTSTVVCGEGPMGNEGFVAATDSQSNCPLWILFSSHSNPFTALSREGDHVVAEAGYGQSWRIPFADPTRFSIVDG
jgi:hypothetical protein